MKKKPPNYPTGVIELKYYAPGPWPATVSTGGACNQGCYRIAHKWVLSVSRSVSCRWR